MLSGVKVSTNLYYSLHAFVTLRVIPAWLPLVYNFDYAICSHTLLEIH